VRGCFETGIRGYPGAGGRRIREERCKEHPMRKLIFVAGLAVGYVLGARAGRERYEQMREAAQRASSNPAVRNSLDSATQAGRQAASRAAGAVADRAGDRLPGPVAEKLRSVQNGQAGGTAPGERADD
jgi:hypothetical protein